MIVGVCGEDNVAELSQEDLINPNLYYCWSKDFLEAGKERLACDTGREDTGNEVKACVRKVPSSRSRWPS